MVVSDGSLMAIPRAARAAARHWLSVKAAVRDRPAWPRNVVTWCACRLSRIGFGPQTDPLASGSWSQRSSCHSAQSAWPRHPETTFGRQTAARPRTARAGYFQPNPRRATAGRECEPGNRCPSGSDVHLTSTSLTSAAHARYTMHIRITGAHSVRATGYESCRERLGMPASVPKRDLLAPSTCALSLLAAAPWPSSHRSDAPGRSVLLG
jgi:hypothetical protein